MLDGKVIAITRDEESAKDFIDMVESKKGRVIALPTISLISKEPEIIKFLDLLKTKRHDYTLFMSANAVRMMFDVFNKMRKIKESTLALTNTKVIAVGPHTKQALEEHNVAVHMMPSKYSSYGVIELLDKKDVRNKKILIPRSSASTDYLAKSLSSMGMIVDELRVYDVKPAEHGEWSKFMGMLDIGEIDCMVFTSASSVNSFFEVAMNYEKQERLRTMLKSIKVIAIGPFTNDALAEQKISAVIAEEHTIRGIFDIAIKLLGK